MSKRNGVIKDFIPSAKSVVKFHSRAEAIGFVNAVNVVRQAEQQLQQAQQQLDGILDELGIEGFDQTKTYTVSDLNELVEA